MNSSRRKEIRDVITKLKDIAGEIESIKDEEEEAFDSLPESFQYGENGEKMQEAINNLEYAFDSIDDIVDYLNEAAA